MRIAFHTLGCKVNSYETESLWELFEQKGYERVGFENTADIYVINTCTVTNTGDKKSRQVIRRAIRKNPEALIVVTGCYAQVMPKEVLDIEGVDIVIGTQGREKIFDYIEAYQREKEPINAVTNIMRTKTYEDLDIAGFEGKTRAFMKIQEGCNNFCTFCIIPWARGRVRSRPKESVLSQANELVAKGYKEIVLTGIHTAGYGEDLEEYTFGDLLSDLDRVVGLERIRISSIEASQITPKVMDVLRNSTKIVDHLHIPIQSGSDSILKKMRRKFTIAEYKEKIEELRSIFPDIAITTDVIVGFPTETEEDVEEALRNMRSIGFSELHVFPYSKRNGTVAAKMEGHLPEHLKKERVARFLECSNELATAYANRFEGDIVTIIPEFVNATGQLEGHSGNYLRVVVDTIENPEVYIGNLLSVEIYEAGYPVCKGRILSV